MGIYRRMSVMALLSLSLATPGLSNARSHRDPGGAMTRNEGEAAGV
jgi:hypothetical protein